MDRTLKSLAPHSHSFLSEMHLIVKGTTRHNKVSLNTSGVVPRKLFINGQP